MRCGFLNYFEAMLRSPQKKNFDFVNYITGMFIAAVTVYFGTAAINFGALALAFLAGFVYLLTVMTSVHFNMTPNLVSQLPLSPKRSLIYRFLSVFVLYLLSVAVIALFLLVIGLVTGGIILMIEGIGGELPPEDVGGAEELDIINPMGVHGGIFAAAYFVFMYGMGMTVSFIKTRKYRTLVVVSLCAAVLVGMILMRNPFIQESYNKMAVPWLCTALCCVAAFAAVGASVYLGIKQYYKLY